MATAEKVTTSYKIQLNLEPSEAQFLRNYLERSYHPRDKSWLTEIVDALASVNIFNSPNYPIKSWY